MGDQRLGSSDSPGTSAEEVVLELERLEQRQSQLKADVAAGLGNFNMREEIVELEAEIDALFRFADRMGAFDRK